jgi:hypothetical protein
MIVLKMLTQPFHTEPSFFDNAGDRMDWHIFGLMQARCSGGLHHHCRYVC